jgi:hypothetical protein
MALNFKRLESISSALKPLVQDGRAFHTCFIYSGSKLLTIGMNQYKKIHPYHKFGKYISYKNEEYDSALHAEIDALIRHGESDCSNLTFINIRIDNNGNPAISKPCGNCQRILDGVGYKNLYYFDGTGYVKHEKPN